MDGALDGLTWMGQLGWGTAAPGTLEPMTHTPAEHLAADETDAEWREHARVMERDEWLSRTDLDELLRARPRITAADLPGDRAALEAMIDYRRTHPLE